MKAKHTPGPWTVPTPASGEDVTVTSHTPIYRNPISVARVYGSGILSKAPAERDANSRLIAAAPDLLAALSELAGVREGRCDSCGCEIAREGYCGCVAEDTFEYNRLCRARAAIVKAGGGNEA